MGHKGPTHLELLNGGVGKESGSSTDSSKLSGPNNKTQTQIRHNRAPKNKQTGGH